MSILTLKPLNFSADLMKWVLTDVSWKWQHVSLLHGWCSRLVYRCVAWCNHPMAHIHLIKYRSCFDREALIESLVSFIKLCVIFVWNFFPLSPWVSLFLLWNMLAVESSVTRGRGLGWGKKKVEKSEREHHCDRKRKSKSVGKSEMERRRNSQERWVRKEPSEAILSLDS